MRSLSRAVIVPATAGGGSGAPTDATYITQTANGSLSAEQALASLATGLLKNANGTGILSIATAGTDYYNPGGTDVAIADGGTGQSSKTAGFDALSPLTTQGDIIYHNGSDNVRLAKGTAAQVLRMNSGATAPEWAVATTGGGNWSLASGGAAGYTVVDLTPFYTGLLSVPASNPTTTAPTGASSVTPISRVDLTITDVYLSIICLGPGSTETGTGSIRVNNTTDNVVFNNTLQWNAAIQQYTATGLSIAIAAGDFWIFKISPPNMATNPTGTFYQIQVVYTVP